MRCSSKLRQIRMRALVSTVALLLHAGLHGPITFAQNVDATQSTVSKAGTPPAGSDRVDADQLVALRKAIAEDDSLDADVKKMAIEQLDAAVSALKNEQRSQQSLQTLKQDADTASDELASIEKQLAESPPEVKSSLTPGDTRESLQADVARAETEAAEATLRREALEQEIARRTTRRGLLPDLITQSRAALTDVTAQLAVPPPDGEPANVTIVRTQALKCKRQALTAELALLEQEGPLYEATARLMTARRDLAARTETEADRRLDSRKKLLAAALRIEAEQQASAARVAALNAEPELQELANRNSELSRINQETVADLEAATLDRDDTQSQMESLKADFETLTQRAEAAQFTHAIGVLLRSHRTTLPSLDRFRSRIASRQPTISELNLQHLDLERERRALVDLDSAVTLAMTKISTESASPDEVRQQVKRLLTAQRDVLSSLTQSMANLLSVLVALDSSERQLIEEVRQQSDYIAEHVLWVRSTTAISTSDASAISSSLNRLNSTMSLRSAGSVLLSDAASHSLIWLVSLGTLVVLVLSRSRIRDRLRDISRAASRSNATEFRPSLSALLMTIGLATAPPAFLWFIGWRLGELRYTDSLLRAGGEALQRVALLFWALEFFRQVFRTNGLAVAHFGWDVKTVTSIQHRLRIILFVTVPLLVIVEFCRRSGDSQLHSTVGRLAFAVMALAQTVVLFGLLKPGSPLMMMLCRNDGDELLDRLRRMSGLIIITSPFVLSVAALSGYYYTALELGIRLLLTAGIVLGVFVAKSLIQRWLLVNYRALAIRHNRERREATRREQEAQGQSDIVEVESVPEIQLSDLNVQTSRLIRLASFLTLLTGIWLIWAEVLPALNILKRVSWRFTELVPGDPEIALADLALGIIAAVVTFVAARNLPGLMEIAVLQRLPLDAGARYAASTIMRYLIFVVGMVTAFQLVGIGWSSVQWLIAAMSVGLGFGLQEIFANFVSGIILLFERPIRVGDTVTINDVTGTVTRIRIRATTILEWNNRELIVPNRDFVTGNLVNWTLSNSNLRVVMTVGVAYGSDTALATRLLYEVAAANPNVLKEPEPVVVFTAFGASSLDFELRCHVPTPQLFRTIAHSLNMEIDQAFRNHNIEIAFPQRDLHLRSVDAGIVQLAKSKLESDS